MGCLQNIFCCGRIMERCIQNDAYLDLLRFFNLEPATISSARILQAIFSCSYTFSKAGNPSYQGSSHILVKAGSNNIHDVIDLFHILFITCHLVDIRIMKGIHNIDPVEQVEILYREHPCNMICNINTFLLESDHRSFICWIAGMKILESGGINDCWVIQLLVIFV